jgi:hypothetical protein
MKKTLVLGILGLALGASTSFGQSSFEFGTYVSQNFFSTPISYGATDVPAGKAGQAIGSGFSAQAYYSVNGGTTWNLIPGSATFFGTDGDLGSGAGYFYGGTPLLASVAPNTSVLMYVSAVNTVQIGTYAAGELVGQSTPFNITVVDPSSPVLPNFGSTTYAGFTVAGVAVVPEPSTFALAGLGLASLVIFRRRK